MTDKRLELLLAAYALEPDDDQMTAAALARGIELGLTEDESYTLLERLHDDGFLKRDEPQRKGDGKIWFYRITRITSGGVRAIDRYKPENESEPPTV